MIIHDIKKQIVNIKKHIAEKQNHALFQMLNDMETKLPSEDVEVAEVSSVKENRVLRYAYDNLTNIQKGLEDSKDKLHFIDDNEKQIQTIITMLSGLNTVKSFLPAETKVEETVNNPNLSDEDAVILKINENNNENEDLFRRLVKAVRFDNSIDENSISKTSPRIASNIPVIAPTSETKSVNIEETNENNTFKMTGKRDALTIAIEKAMGEFPNKNITLDGKPETLEAIVLGLQEKQLNFENLLIDNTVLIQWEKDTKCQISKNLIELLKENNRIADNKKLGQQSNNSSSTFTPMASAEHKQDTATSPVSLIPQDSAIVVGPDAPEAPPLDEKAYKM